MRVVGGMPVGLDGRIHTTFGHNPSTLRLCSFEPNLQNIPRGGNDPIESLVKGIFKAPKGYQFVELDFSGIEAVLVGYFMGSRRYTWLAQRDIHSFVTAAKFGKPADLEWPEQDLIKYLKEIKREFGKTIRQAIKPVVHGGNYLESAAGMYAHDPQLFESVKDAKNLRDLYMGLFPEIPQWHHDLCWAVDGQLKQDREDLDNLPQTGVAYVRNPFGYLHHFYHVLDWERVEFPDGHQEWIAKYGDDAKRLIAFLPQSTAAAIIKKAARTLWYDYPWIGQWMRLLIHDSIFFECPDQEVDRVIEVATQVMEAPILELPLDPAWGMGSHLTIPTEAKVGVTWSEMH